MHYSQNMARINKSTYEPGRHIILDCKGDIAHYDERKMLVLLESAAQASKATILSSHFHRFGDEGQGITGVLVLAESHITVHTWPELDYAAFDVFMCGECNPENAANVITDNLNPNEFNKQTIYRDASYNGILSDSSLKQVVI
jgi:S-adenosylmethionine decarboxylase